MIYSYTSSMYVIAHVIIAFQVIFFQTYDLMHTYKEEIRDCLHILELKTAFSPANFFFFNVTLSIVYSEQTRQKPASDGLRELTLFHLAELISMVRFQPLKGSVLSL